MKISLVSKIKSSSPDFAAIMQNCKMILDTGVAKSEITSYILFISEMSE